MVNHMAQAQFERAKWLPAVLFPSWCFQFLIPIAMIAVSALRLHGILVSDPYHWAAGRPGQIAWTATNMTLSFVVATCTVTEIFKYTREALTPWTMLFTQLIKLACTLVICAFDTAMFPSRKVAEKKHHETLVSLCLDGALFIVVTSFTIYTIFIFRRSAIFNGYSMPANVRAYGFNDDEERELSYTSFRNPMKKRLSVDSGSQEYQQPKNYYHHQRDTQFDAYLARRSSLAAEVGELEGGGAGSLRDLQASIGSANTRPRGASFNWGGSYTSDHVLVAVPEEQETQTQEDAARQSKDTTALLGNRLSDNGRNVSKGIPVHELDVTDASKRREVNL